MFLVKKVLGHLLMPLPLALVLLALGLLLVATRRRVRGWLLVAAGTLVLLVAGNRGLSISLTASLEKLHPPAPALPAETWPEELRTAAFVVVLGGGHGDAPGLPAGQRLSPSMRGRLMEGLRLALALPDAWLVVSGPRAAFDADAPPAAAAAAPTHARVLADAAVELGFPRERIVEIDTARDTAEEVAALRRLVGEERIALVTSAWHLPRAQRLAEAEGLRAFPCPADYLGGRDGRPARLAWVTWDTESLTNSTRAWREYLGQTWARVVVWWRSK
jgi:uncharacterized SAM-binding protein YcdF (DUF218 family)